MLSCTLCLFKFVWPLTPSQHWKQQFRSRPVGGENKLLCWHFSDSMFPWSPQEPAICSMAHRFYSDLYDLSPMSLHKRNALSKPRLCFRLLSESPRPGEDCFLQHRTLCKSAAARTGACAPLQGQWPNWCFVGCVMPAPGPAELHPVLTPGPLRQLWCPLRADLPHLSASST